MRRLPRTPRRGAKQHRQRDVPEAARAFSRNGRDRRSSLGNVLESEEWYSLDRNACVQRGAQRYANLAGQRFAGQRGQDFASREDRASEHARPPAVCASGSPTGKKVINGPAEEQF